MNAEILDKRNEKTSVCYLVKILLKDYIESLPTDYKEYEIQREIVLNSYLDTLIATVISKTHIPPIVLILDEYTVEDKMLKISSFKILDGLQRTYRLNAIWNTMNLFLQEYNSNNDILTISKYQLSKRYSKSLLKIDSNTKILQSIIDYFKSVDDQEINLLDGFEKNYQWFEVWSGLSPQDEVTKMLVLNAGHKPVKIKHQLELVFRNLLPDLKKIGIENFRVVREKEKSSIQFSKDREVGSFHFSHLISSLLSLKDGKPTITNSTSIQELQNKDFDTENDSKYFEFPFLENFIKSLIDLDELIYNSFEDIGRRWFGREVSLVGIYGALGDEVNKGNISLHEAPEYLTSIIQEHPENLNLKVFEETRNSLELSKVNFGNVNKNAVFKAFQTVLANGNLNTPIEWNLLF